MESLQDRAWLQPFIDLADGLGQAAPRFGASLAILCAGVLLALLLRGALSRLLTWGGVDESLARLWVFRFWSRSHQGQTPSRSLANLAFYSLLLLFMALALRALGGGLGQGLLESLLGVVPRLLSVFFILLLSGLLASFLSLLVQLVLAGSELGHAVLWGKVAAWGTFGAGVIFSLEPLGLAGQLLTQVLLIVLGSVCFAAALAFGLGCKDLARETLIELLAQDKRSDPGA